MPCGGNEKALFLRILLDEGDEELIGPAGETGFEHPAPDPTIGDMIDGDAQALKGAGGRMQATTANICLRRESRWATF